MHVPDGFLDAPTSILTGAIALAAVTRALRGSRTELEERVVPLAGLTSAFIFAAQMINFPVGLGTSGHLMGGALAAVLVGPRTGILCLSVVLLVQALLFADGGLTALGTNVTLLGVTTVLVGWIVTRAALAVLPRRPSSVVPAAASGAFLSVVVAALVFVGLFAVGGQAAVPLGPVTVSMLAWHSLIGIGEAALTAATVSAVLAVRPDLVHAARGLRPQLLVGDALGRDAIPAGPGEKVGPVTRGPRVPASALVAGGGLVTLLVAGVASSFASDSPDGLEQVAYERGFLDSARDHLFAGSPLADYGDGAVPVGVAGVLGVLVTLGVVRALVRLARRGRPAARGAEPVVVETAHG